MSSKYKPYTDKDGLIHLNPIDLLIEEDDEELDIVFEPAAEMGMDDRGFIYVDVEDTSFSVDLVYIEGGLTEQEFKECLEDGITMVPLQSNYFLKVEAVDEQ